MAPKKKAGGNPPIFAAIDKGQDDAIEDILAAEPAVLELRNKDGWTPLIAAAYSGEMEIVEKLVKAGADVRASCRDGDTALHYASAQGHMDIIKFLASHGAKLNVQDKDGETPFDVAGKNVKVRRLIQQLMDAQLSDDKEGEDEEEDGDEEEGEGAAGAAGEGPAAPNLQAQT